MNYPPNDRRAEAGDVVNDLPSTEVPALLEQGLIETVDKIAEVD